MTALEKWDVVRADKRTWGVDVSVNDIFPDLNGRVLLDAIWEVYGVGMGERKTIQFFQDSNVPDQSLPFASRVRNLARHSVFNPRQQEGVKAAYVKSCKARGICESVRGEAWATQPTANDDGRMGPYLLISSASLVEAFYTALNEEPGNPNLIATLRHGIQVRILSSRTPPGICKYLTKLHNRFHGGASTNFLELIGFIPDAARYEESLKRLSLHLCWG